MSVLHFTDAEALEDLGTFVARAREVDPDGAIRLQATGTTLAAWVGVLPGRGLLGEGTVLGLRLMPLAEPLELETTVPLGGVTDRLARRAATGDASGDLPVPPTTVHVAWAAMAPPRAGWEPTGQISGAELRQVATAGITQIARGSPEGSGAHAVTALRQQVWGRRVVDDATVPDDTDEDQLAEAGLLPAGAAFAAYSLGFLTPGADGRVLRRGRWRRPTLPAGHVVVR